MRVKCTSHEHKTMCPARARTRTAQSGVELTNHEATAPHTLQGLTLDKIKVLNAFLFFCIIKSLEKQNTNKQKKTKKNKVTNIALDN